MDIAGSLGFNKSKSSSRSNMSQDVFGGQHYKNMYGDMGQGYNQMQPYANMGFGMMPQMQQQMNQIYGQGMQGAQGQQAGGAYGDTSRYNDMIYDAMANPQQSNQSKMYSNIIGGPGNTYADPLVDAMRQGSNENMDARTSMNDLAATGMGQGGSSRHAMQNAMTNQQGMQDQNLNEMGIREGNYGRDMDWKMGIAQQADSNRQNDLNRAQQMVSGANQSQQYGTNYMPTMQNLSMGYMAPWMQAMQGPWQNQQNYAQNMGDPTVLTEGTSRGKSSGWGVSTSGSGSM